MFGVNIMGLPTSQSTMSQTEISAGISLYLLVLLAQIWIDEINQFFPGFLIIIIWKRYFGHSCKLFHKRFLMVHSIGVKRFNNRAVATQEAVEKTSFYLLKISDEVKH